MRFIVMHKVDANMEAGGPPSQEIIQQMGALVQSSLKEGVFLNGAGLHRSARRARLTRKDGVATLTKGPYPGQNELVASFTLLGAPSLDDAVAHAGTLASALGGDVEIEVGPVVEPWDLGVMPKPDGKVPERFLLLCKATPADESGDRFADRTAVKLEVTRLTFYRRPIVMQTVDVRHGRSGELVVRRVVQASQVDRVKLRTERRQIAAFSEWSHSAAPG